MIRVWLFIGLIFFSGCSVSQRIDKLYERNYKYEEEGNIKKRIEVLEKFKKLKFINDGFYSDYSSKYLLFRDLGQLYLAENKYELALENLEESKKYIDKEILKERDKHWKHIIEGYKSSVDYFIAKVYNELGQYNKAIKLLENDLKNYPMGTILANKIKMDLANLYIKSKNIEKAKEIILEITSSKDDFSYENKCSIFSGKLYNFIGTEFLKEKKYIEAKKYFLYPLNATKEFHPQFTEMINNGYNVVGMNTYEMLQLPYYDKALSCYYLGTLAYKERKYQLSKNWFNKAIDALQQQNNISNINISDIKFNLAWLYYDIDNNNKKTLSLLKEVLDITEKTESKYNLMWVTKSIASYYYLISDYKNNYLFNKKAYDIFIENRIYDFLLLNNQDKENYLNKEKNPIDRLLYSVYKYTTVYPVFEKNKKKIDKGREKLLKTTLTDWLNYKGSISDSENMIRTLENQTTDKEVKEQIEQLKHEQQKLAIFIQNAKSKEQIEQQEQLIDNLFKSLAKKVNRFQEENDLQAIDYRDISKYLKADELYIDYARAGDDYYLFSLDHQNHISFVKLERQFVLLVQSFRDEVKNKKLQMNQNSKDRLSQLYKLLLDPIKEQLTLKESLVISTDGALRLLPFETLYNQENQHYLIEDKNIRYIPSGKEFVRLHRYTKKETTSNNEIVVFANPNWSKSSNKNPRRRVSEFYQDIDLSSLKGTEEELKEIKKLFGKSVSPFKNKYASEANLLKVKRPKILHIATHGFFNNDKKIKNPMLKSGLALSGANQSRKNDNINGFVTALKLSALDLKGTELVVLSACDTGMVDIDATDSISGLGKAFIQAGAKDVVMSLWSVDDSATKDLMISFYKQIKEKPDYSLALKNAKLKMIREGKHPFYWGGFVVLGL